MISNKANEMLEYHFFQMMLFNQKWMFLLSLGIDAGWATSDMYFEAILKKSPHALTKLEAEMRREWTELEQIEKEAKLLRDSIYFQPEDVYTLFPLKGEFKKKYFAQLEYANKYLTYDLMDVFV